MTSQITAQDYNFLDPKVRANPYPYYEALRRESPIHPMMEGKPLFAVTRFKDVEYVLHHPTEFSSTAFQVLFSGAQPESELGSTCWPPHARGSDDDIG